MNDQKKTPVSHSSMMFPGPASSPINNYHHFVPPPNPPPVPPYMMPNQTPWAGATAAAANFSNVLTPNHPYLQVFFNFAHHNYFRIGFLALNHFFQDYALLVLNNITRLQHQQQSQAVDANPGRVQQSSFDPNNNWKAELNNNNASKYFLKKNAIKIKTTRAALIAVKNYTLPKTTIYFSVDGQKNSFNSPSPRSLQARVGSPRTSSSPNMPNDNGNLARTLDMTEKMMQQFCLGK